MQDKALFHVFTVRISLFGETVKATEFSVLLMNTVVLAKYCTLNAKGPF